MIDVEFKKKEYTKEMRKMKRTIVILVGVFIVLICFSAYVLRIKGTRNDFTVAHFTQNQYKGGSSGDIWPNKPEEDNSLNVLEPGRIDESHKPPHVEVGHSGGHGGHGGHGYGHISDNVDDRARGPTHQILPNDHKPDSSLDTTSYKPRKPILSVPKTNDQSFKDESSNREDSQESNTVQTDNGTKSGALFNLRSRLEQLAKASGLNVAGMLAKLLDVNGGRKSTIKPTSTPLQGANRPGNIDRNRNLDTKAESANHRSWYMYDRYGKRRKVYLSDNPFRDENKHGYKTNNNLSKDNKDRFRDRYWKDSDSDRGGMDQDGYYRNRGSSRERVNSDRRYDDVQVDNQRFGRRRGHYHRHKPEFDDEYNNVRNQEMQNNFQSHNPPSPDANPFEKSSKMKSIEKSHQENTESDQINDHNMANPVAITTKSNLAELSHLLEKIPGIELKDQSKEDNGPLYITKNMIKKRIKHLLEQQKFAKQDDTSLIQSISLLQATLDSIEWELNKNNHNRKKVDVTDKAGNISTSFQTKQSKHREVTSTSATTSLDSTPTSNTLNKDRESTSPTKETITQHVSETTAAKPGYSTTQASSKIKAVKTHASSNDISGDDINLKDWYGKNRIIVKILRQLKEDPTKVDVYDLSKHFRSAVECVALRTVSPHAVICINNPRLDKPLSQSLKIVGLWENTEVEMFKRVLKSNSSYQVIDLGATLGVFSITAASMGRSVVAVEPLPLNIAPFHKSVAFNSFPRDKITLVTNAVTDYRGIAELIYRPYGNLADVRTSSLSLRDLSEYSDNVHDLVRTVTLDDLRSVVPFRSAVMKIDIQGDEYVIFKRAKKFFNDLDISYIFMHWIPTENLSGTKYIADFLTERGYKAKTTLDDDYLAEDELLLIHDIIIWIKQRGNPG